MSDAAAPHVVLGAAGGTGSAVVRELVARGLPVHTLNSLGDMARALVKLVYGAARHVPKPRVVSRRMIRLVGLFKPLVRELNETLYQFEQPFVSDASKFQGAFGPLEPTPHPEAVKRTVDWFRGRQARTTTRAPRSNVVSSITGHDHLAT
jgi:NAD(P)-dependent dehydrogenase (short-subunit alcohol dehydrogenase family)